MLFTSLPPMTAALISDVRQIHDKPASMVCCDLYARWLIKMLTNGQAAAILAEMTTETSIRYLSTTVTRRSGQGWPSAR